MFGCYCLGIFLKIWFYVDINRPQINQIGIVFTSINKRIIFCIVFPKIIKGSELWKILGVQPPNKIIFFWIQYSNFFPYMHILFINKDLYPKKYEKKFYHDFLSSTRKIFVLFYLLCLFIYPFFVYHWFWKIP